MAKIKKSSALIDGLVGGLDTFLSETEIDDSSTPDCDNVRPVGLGGIRTRQGKTAYGGEISDGYSVQGRYIYYNASNEIEELVVSNGVLYKKDGDSWTEITGGTFSTTARVYAAQAGTRLYFADGVTALCYYDGSDIVTTGVADAPLPSFIIFYNRRLYCNDVDNPDRYYFGGAMGSDGTVANTGNFASGSPSYGGYAGFGLGKVVTGLAKLGESYLVVGLKDGIHRIAPTADTGDSNALTHSEEMISNSIGIAHHGAIDNIENDMAFLSWGDVYLLGEVASYVSLRTRVISSKVSGITSAIASSGVEKAAMLYSPANKELYLAYASGADYNNKVLVYNTYYKSWWRYSNWSASCFTEHTDADNASYLIYASDNPDDSYCYQMNNTANDAGSAISWYWKSKVYDLKNFDFLKKFKRWALLFGPVYGSMTINIYIGGTTNTSTVQLGSTSGSAGLGCLPLATFTLGAEINNLSVDSVTSDWRWKKIARPNEGSTIQLKFSGSGVGEAGQVEKIKIYYNENPNKKDRTKRITAN